MARKIGETHYHAHLGLLDNDRAIKGLVVYYVVWLGSIKEMGLSTCARYTGMVPCCGQDINFKKIFFLLQR